jgi:2',3'-cyclic-nucleotide 2'-phosphodiesterase (5'-nucleotidase family)
LAAAARGIDAIVGGHSHTALLEPIRIGGTAIAHAGAFGRYLGRLDLTVENGKKITAASPARLAERDSQLIPCGETVPPDPTLSGVLELVRFEAEALRKKRGE